MKALILGGTAQLGRALATTARDRGWDVTCLARGTSEPQPASSSSAPNETHPEDVAYRSERDYSSNRGGVLAVAARTGPRVLFLARHPPDTFAT